MVGSGNDFIVVKDKPAGNLSALARSLCDRKIGIGADGLLILEKSKKADIRMRIFNADGSEAEMCGNGARCAAYVIASPAPRHRRGNVAKQSRFLRLPRRLRLLAMTVETKAGVIKAEVYGNRVKVQITEPKNIKLDIPIKVNPVRGRTPEASDGCLRQPASNGVNGRLIKVNFINTGVPHAVIFVDRVANINLADIGRSIRSHKKFAPGGTNVNFVETRGTNLIRIRTYERGVEGETLSCGTGGTASALIFALKNNLDGLVKVQTESGEILKVYFQRDNFKFHNVCLEGSAKIVYKGEYYV